MFTAKGPDWYNERAYKDPASYNVSRYRNLWAVFYAECDGADSVLDLGCGTGAMLGDWPDLPPPRRVGIDFAENAVDYASILYADCEFHLMEFETLMHKRPLWWEIGFGAITICEVLEHIDNDVDVWNWACRSAWWKVVASVPVSGKVRCKSHTDTVYTPDTVLERFPGAEIVDCPDDRFIVFRFE